MLRTDSDHISGLKNRANIILDTIENLLGLAQGDELITDDQGEQERLRQLIQELMLGTDEQEGLLKPLIEVILLGGEEKKDGLLHQALQAVLLGGDEEGGSLLDQAILAYLMGGEDGNGVLPRLDTLTADMQTAQMDIRQHTVDIQVNTRDITTLQGNVMAIYRTLSDLRREIDAIKSRPCNCGDTPTSPLDPVRTQDQARTMAGGQTATLD